jgi:hypothetical protein
MLDLVPILGPPREAHSGLMTPLYSEVKDPARRNKTGGRTRMELSCTTGSGSRARQQNGQSSELGEGALMPNL